MEDQQEEFGTEELGIPSLVININYKNKIPCYYNVCTCDCVRIPGKKYPRQLNKKVVGRIADNKPFGVIKFTDEFIKKYPILKTVTVLRKESKKYVFIKQGGSRLGEYQKEIAPPKSTRYDPHKEPKEHIEHIENLNISPEHNEQFLASTKQASCFLPTDISFNCLKIEESTSKHKSLLILDLDKFSAGNIDQAHLNQYELLLNVPLHHTLAQEVVAKANANNELDKPYNYNNNIQSYVYTTKVEYSITDELCANKDKILLNLHVYLNMDILLKKQQELYDDAIKIFKHLKNSAISYDKKLPSFVEQHEQGLFYVDRLKLQDEATHCATQVLATTDFNLSAEECISLFKTRNRIKTNINA